MSNPQIKAILERVCFQTRHVSIRASEKSDALIARAKAEHAELYEKYKGSFSAALWFIPLTAGITFNFQGDEAPMLLEFRDFWQAFIAAMNDESRQVKLIMDWCMDTHQDIMVAWNEAIKSGNFPIKHDLIPESALTAEEQEALKDNASPLVQPAA